MQGVRHRGFVRIGEVDMHWVELGALASGPRELAIAVVSARKPATDPDGAR